MDLRSLGKMSGKDEIEVPEHQEHECEVVAVDPVEETMKMLGLKDIDIIKMMMSTMPASEDGECEEGS